MVRHIVLWRLNEQAQGATKAENAIKIKALIESLNGKCAGLIAIRVASCAPGEAAADLALVADFVSWEALEAYQRHPEHEAMKPFIMAARETRQVADFEIDGP